MKRLGFCSRSVLNVQVMCATGRIAIGYVSFNNTKKNKGIWGASCCFFEYSRLGDIIGAKLVRWPVAQQNECRIPRR